MNKVFFILLLLLCGSAVNVNAQVRIGGNSDPNTSAVLDLNVDNDVIDGTFGLALPRVMLDNTTKWQLAGSNKVLGMIVYNTNKDVGRGVYVWQGDGIGWKLLRMDENNTSEPVIKDFRLAPETLTLTTGKTGYIQVYKPQSMQGDLIQWDWNKEEVSKYALVMEPNKDKKDNDVAVVVAKSTAGSFIITATVGSVSHSCTVTIVNNSDNGSSGDNNSNNNSSDNNDDSTLKGDEIFIANGASNKPVPHDWYPGDGVPGTWELLSKNFQSTGHLYWQPADKQTNVTWNEAQKICKDGWRLPNVWEAACALNASNKLKEGSRLYATSTGNKDNKTGWFYGPQALSYDKDGRRSFHVVRCVKEISLDK